MWTCKKCKEENEDSFDACWKCQEDSVVGLKKSQIYQDEIGIKKKKDNEENEKEKIINEQLDKKAVQIWFVTILYGCISAVIIIFLMIVTGIGGGAIQGLVVIGTFFYFASQSKKKHMRMYRMQIIEELEKEIKKEVIDKEIKEV